MSLFGFSFHPCSSIEVGWFFCDINGKMTLSFSFRIELFLWMFRHLSNTSAFRRDFFLSFFGKVLLVLFVVQFLGFTSHFLLCLLSVSCLARQLKSVCYFCFCQRWWQALGTAVCLSKSRLVDNSLQFLVKNTSVQANIKHNQTWCLNRKMLLPCSVDQALMATGSPDCSDSV